MRLFKWIILSVFFSISTPLLAGDFSFKDINGKRHNLSDYAGKWVIVNYWATYCAPCRTEVPELNRIKRKYRDKVAIIGLEAGSSSDAKIREFMNTYGMRFTVAPTQGSTINPLGTISKLPTTFIVSPEGKVVDTHKGIIAERHVRAYLNQQNETQTADVKPTATAVAETKQQPTPVARVTTPAPAKKPIVTTVQTTPVTPTPARVVRQAPPPTKSNTQKSLDDLINELGL